MRRAAWLGAALIACTSLARASEGDIDPKAKAHLDRGLERYQAEDYAGAIREFEQGYAIDPNPALLYAQAQAERLSGQCGRAIEHYQKFLDAGPAPEREAAARANLARCKDELAAAAPKPEPEEPTAAPPTAPTPAASATRGASPTRSTTRSSPWYTDVLGDVLVGTGVVALGASGYFYLQSRKNESDARDAADAPTSGTYQAHVERIDRAERQGTISAIAGGVGLALVTGGVLRYLLRSPEPEGPAVGVWATPQSAGLGARGRF